MLTRLLQNAFGRRRIVDPSQFGDPMAAQIAWTPQRRGGTNFCTRTLVEVSPERYEFQVSGIATFVYSVPMLIGIGLLGYVAYVMFRDGASFFGDGASADLQIRAGLGVVLLAVGGVLFYFALIPIVVDTRLGFYWKGRHEPDPLIDLRPAKHAIPLERVYAIQILKEYVRAKHSFDSYELNLVLDDRSRVNVVDHGDINRVRADAMTLSTVLDKPVWDGAY